MKLYRRYAGIANDERLTNREQRELYSMQCKIPTQEELAKFERVWDPQAPRRCCGCYKKMPEDAPASQVSCNNCGCQANGWKLICRECKSNVVLKHGVQACVNRDGCASARASHSVAELIAKTGDDPGFRHANNLWWGRCDVDRSHEPAWKKLRCLP